MNSNMSAQQASKVVADSIAFLSVIRERLVFQV